jgi:hypothetical protein
MSEKQIVQINGVDAFTCGYVTAMLWAETGEDDAPLDEHFDGKPGEYGAETWQRILDDCAKFQADYADWIGAGRTDDDRDVDACAGIDFWLTRNRHGAGFWDGDWNKGEELTAAAKRFGQCDLYVGDDGKLHF